MKRSLIFGIALVVAGAWSGGSASAQDKAVSPKAVQRLNRAPVNHEILQVKIPRPTQTKLANGLTVLLLERHKVPTVNFDLWINTGSLDDPKEMPGLARFTVDMLREGTARRSSSQIASEIDTLGAQLRTDVEFGSTYSEVSTSGFAENAAQLLDLLSDMMLNPAFPGDELEKYKTRQLSDLEQQRSDPDFLSHERLFRALYGNSPAAEIAPTAASVNGVKADDLKKFHAQHYVPGRAMLGVVGDFDSKQMLALVEKYFGAAKGTNEKPASNSLAAAPGAFKIYLVDRPDSVQTNILAGELGVPRNNPDYIALRVMNRVLGEGTSARLFMNLREEKGYTYGAYSAFEADTYARPIIANTEVRNAVTDGSVHEILGELKRLREEPVPDAELDDSRRAIVAGFALSLESSRELLDMWMRAKHSGLPDDYWDRYPAEIAKVDAAAVQRVSRKYLDAEHLQLVCVGNGKEIRSALEKYGPVEVYDINGKRVAQ
ncbi:MAG TPA: pitrilysin family protein [Terriglobales bacterium]|nr:pitrilysin family protein [Terriglobales bacterium]